LGWKYNLYYNGALAPFSFSNFKFISLFLIFCSLFLIALSSCSMQQKISRSAQQVIKDSSLRTAHVGISIYEPATSKYWYNYNADKYFIPASNTKIPTCYAAMKYLGDSLVGLRWEEKEKGNIWVQFTGDPIFLSDEFPWQPVWTFFKTMKPYKLSYAHGNWDARIYGSGWSWNDFNETYMLERSPMPLFGNRVRFYYKEGEGIKAIPSLYGRLIPHDLNKPELARHFDIEKEWGTNVYSFPWSEKVFTEKTIPLSTYDGMELFRLLKDSLKLEYILPVDSPITHKLKNSIKTQPADSLLRIMMHRSDNFFAEQALLMVSNELLNVMNDHKIIDTILQTDFKDLPQKPGWADGSGLSRYNLFTPQDFVTILDKMKKEFGMERIKTIFPTGGEGTLSNYYKTESGYIYAKTGTLSGVVTLSGYLYTRKNKLLLFSILVNNHSSSATAIRRAVEKFLVSLRSR
jgi:serine-type D-Ala-D-Ala carboxypeptidase/endopeptidase (penicillin-binding protein 4)